MMPSGVWRDATCTRSTSTNLSATAQDHAPGLRTRACGDRAAIGDAAPLPIVQASNAALPNRVQPANRRRMPAWHRTCKLAGPEVEARRPGNPARPPGARADDPRLVRCAVCACSVGSASRSATATRRRRWCGLRRESRSARCSSSGTASGPPSSVRPRSSMRRSLGPLPAVLLLAGGHTIEGVLAAYLVNRYASGRHALQNPAQQLPFCRRRAARRARRPGRR